MTSSKIGPLERDIVGTWILERGTVRADEVCVRIEKLVNEYLVKVATSAVWGDWQVLYRDPGDGRYWEKTFPQSEMAGGGPPSLTLIDIAKAQERYSLL